MAYSGPFIDSDVHHIWKSEEAVIEHLEPRWQEYFRMGGRQRASINPVIMHFPHTHGVNKRTNALPPDGTPAGSDYPMMRSQLLDPLNVRAAILSYDVGFQAGLPNLYASAELCRAVNDWTLDYWIERTGDDRLFGAVLVPTQTPEEAAKEIRRIGCHPRMAEVLVVVNGLGRPLGHPVYHPIFEAAAEVGKPVAVHVGDTVGWNASHPSAGGNPNSRLEHYGTNWQNVLPWIASFFVHGVFEKYPTLKLLIVEVGVAWIPNLLWKLDSHYHILRRESPWLKRLPSEYFREHVRVTTQPLELSPDKDQLIELLEAFGGVEDILCFATDYPHWDSDDPTYVTRRLPEAWLPKVCYENARALYGWKHLEPHRPALIKATT